MPYHPSSCPGALPPFLSHPIYPQSRWLHLPIPPESSPCRCLPCPHPGPSLCHLSLGGHANPLTHLCLPLLCTPMVGPQHRSGPCKVTPAAATAPSVSNSKNQSLGSSLKPPQRPDPHHSPVSLRLLPSGTHNPALGLRICSLHCLEGSSSPPHCTLEHPPPAHAHTHRPTCSHVTEGSGLRSAPTPYPLRPFSGLALVLVSLGSALPLSDPGAGPASPERPVHPGSGDCGCVGSGAPGSLRLRPLGALDVTCLQEPGSWESGSCYPMRKLRHQGAPDHPSRLRRRQDASV